MRLAPLLQRAWRTVSAWWAKPVTVATELEAPPPEAAPELAPEPLLLPAPERLLSVEVALEAAPPADVPAASIPREERHEHVFRRDILDKLDDYMHFIGRMRTVDPDAYALFSQVGGRLGTRFGAASHQTLEPWFLETLPGFGCITLSVGDLRRDEEQRGTKVSPRFMYFQKYNKPCAAIQPVAAGAVYVMTLYYDIDDGKRHARLPLTYPVVVLPDGTVLPLKLQCIDRQVIRHRHGGDRNTTSTFSRSKWDYPRIAYDFAAEHKRPVEEALRWMFVWTANTWMATHASMIHVTASKGGLTAAFGVDITRTPYFFRDRDEVVTQRGSRARIFHIVRGHVRTTRRGKSVPIRMHFAGLRRFRWNGYEIGITVPGRDHADLAAWDLGAIDSEHHVNERTATNRQTGRLLADHVRNGWKMLERSRAA